MKKLFLLVAVLIQLLLSAGCYIVTTPSEEVVVVPPPPPAIVVPVPPRLVLIPEIGIYYAPDIEVELYFRGGGWFYFHNGYWYKGRDHRGPWVYVPMKKLPREFSKIPPGFRKVPPGQIRNHKKEERGKRGREFKY